MAVLVLCAIAIVAAVVLYVCSRKFAIQTDPRAGKVLEILPKANCGGCGYAGCQAMAEALVQKADGKTDAQLNCPVGGAEVMSQIGSILGLAKGLSQPKIAVVRCAGCDMLPMVAYDGLRTCAAMNMCGTGENGCGNGCLGCGDCVRACTFGGIAIDPVRKIPVVNANLCTACGACSKVCPRHIIELRHLGVKGHHVYVSCLNRDRGPVSVKVCSHSCIGCGKCAKECPFDAVSVENNVAYIDDTKCRACRKCVAVCPRKAIVADGFPIHNNATNKSVATAETVASNDNTSIN